MKRSVQILSLLSILSLSSFGRPLLSAEELPPGQAKIWQEPPASPNLFWGSGGEAEKPAGPFVFDGEDSKGTNPKIFVKDQRGVRWGVKFGDETRAEVAGSRFLWAAGYRTHVNYFVPEGIIQGLPQGILLPPQIDKATGKFTNARFKKRALEAGVAKVEDRHIWWSWDDKDEVPFVGSKELSGLLLMNVLMSNFDSRPHNNIVQTVYYKDGRVENWYMIGDIGGMFGKTRGAGKWEYKDYVKEPFIEKVTDNSVKLFHAGAKAKEFQSIPLEHAKWIYGILSRLQASQIEDAFRAAYLDQPSASLANARDQETVKSFARAFEQRLAQLNRAVQGGQ